MISVREAAESKETWRRGFLPPVSFFMIMQIIPISFANFPDCRAEDAWEYVPDNSSAAGMDSPCGAAMRRLYFVLFPSNYTDSAPR
jgi:hypothetical protein